MIGRERVLSLVPHAGRMCLIEAVERWDASGIVCRVEGHRAADHPLARDGVLKALHLVEYGAQAMAVHGGLVAEAVGNPAPPGLLATARDVALEVERLDDLAGPLHIEARRLAGDPAGWMYAFEARAGEQVLGRGRLVVIFRP